MKHGILNYGKKFIDDEMKHGMLNYGRISETVSA